MQWEKTLFDVEEDPAMFDAAQRAERRSYNDMTRSEQRAWEIKQAKKNRPKKKKRMTLQEFIALKSKRIAESRMQTESCAPQKTEEPSAPSH